MTATTEKTDNGKARRISALDLTTGKPLRRILVFMLPLLVGNIFQQLYSMVDTVVVGQTLGSAALSGVGSTGAICFLILGFVSGLTQGFSVVTSQRRGARDDDGMRRSFAAGIVLTAAVISLLTVVAVFSAKPLLVAMNTYPEYLPYALEYVTVLFGGMLLSAFYNQFASTLRAIGDSFVPLVILIASCFVNVALDCLFIMVFKTGVGGAAAATLVSQALSAVATFVYAWIKYPSLRFSARQFLIGPKIAIEHLRLGLPMALHYSVVSIGMIVCQTALNTMDPEAITAYVAAGKIDNFACAAVNSIGAAAATYVGQNYGARRYDRIRLGMKQLTLFSLALCAALGATVVGLYKPLTMLFIAKPEQTDSLFRYALTYLSITSGFYFLLATLCTTRSALQGMGRGIVALASAAAEVVVRVVVALIAMNCGSYIIVCMCNCLSWLGADIILVPYFLYILRRYVPLKNRKVEDIRLPDPSVVPMLSEGGGARRRRARRR